MNNPNQHKPDINRCLKLLQDNFSLITVGDNKIPNIKWKEYQTKPMDRETFTKCYNIEGVNPTRGVGILTGYDNLEVVDVDLKVFDNVTKRDEFWNEFLSFVKDNIEDFDDKFVIVKTVNSGYHILYKCEKIEGNKKLATLKGMTSAIIETRGRGGYVWIYNKFILGNSYRNIRYISIEDRDTLIDACKIYNYVDDENKNDSIKVSQKYNEADVPVWEDYDSKVSVWDLIRDEFTIVKKLSDRIVVKRNGSSNPTSGSIFTDSQCLYLFSTGTRYPHEKLLSAFSIYTIQKHNGNYSDAAKQLYKEGYGSRLKNYKKEPEKLYDINYNLTDDFPIQIFPEPIQRYIIEVHQTLNASIDYLGCSFLWVLSLCVGNAFKIQIKKGWVEAGVLWIAIVGRAGIGKTHNIHAMTFPLLKVNDREIIRYNEKYKQYKEYNELTKKEKENVPEVEEPKKGQFIVGDITIESFFDHHEQNKNGIGILRDELSGWIKDLNKYRPGSDLETYLSCWSNQSIMLNRKVARSAYVPNAFVPILGGVQPSILSMHYTPENKENGFIDRILLCYPDLEVEKYNDNEMSDDILEWYSETVIGLFDQVKNQFIRYDNLGNVKPTNAVFLSDAKKKWVEIFNKITDMQNSETENEYMKSILPKQKSYVARFSLLLNFLYSAFDNKIKVNYIEKKSVEGAELLSDYFIKMAKKNKFDALERSDMIDLLKYSGKITNKEKFAILYKTNPEVNRSKVADQLNVSRQTINNWIKEFTESVK
jgi:hypothetical protein